MEIHTENRHQPKPKASKHRAAACSPRHNATSSLFIQVLEKGSRTSFKMGHVPMIWLILALWFHKCYGITDVTSRNDHEHQLNDANETNSTITPRKAGYGLVTFEDQKNPVHFEDEQPGAYGLISFKDQPANHHRDEPSKLPFRFENQGLDNNENANSDLYQDPSINAGSYGLLNPNHQELDNQNPVDQPGGGITFQDDNRIENNPGQNSGQKKKKRRRRRRKPRLQQYPGQSYGFAGQPPVGNIPGYPGGPAPVYPGPAIGPAGQYYRPPRRPRPSYAEEALSSITHALTSIARHDDHQCVPRLLCEVAGGRAPAEGAGAGVLQTIANLQPLLTLLAAYNGISTSPLFVFGRAAILGMTSKGNAGTCRYAYPQCPTDPEKLVEYLNNHNGGFFRFFNAPQQYPGQLGQQNLEQFYNHLSNIPGQYGLLQNQQYPGQYPNQPVPSYPNGLVPQPHIQDQQNYGLHPIGTGYGLQNPNQVYSGYSQQNPNLPNQGFGFQNQPGLYSTSQNYGNRYPYHNNNGYGFGNQNRYKNHVKDEIGTNKIEKRIQNRPDLTYVDKVQNENMEFKFPRDSRYEIDPEKQRFGRTIKFPQNDQTVHKPSINTSVPQINNKKAKGFNFPESQSNRQYIDYYDYPPYTQVFNTNNFKLDENGFYVESNNDYDFNTNMEEKEEGVEIVYVVRGNSDPNHPEIVKLRPGQKLQ
ncbi:uncharacterized protein LOC125488817 [Plutella xylostella]|uniref:uncharacterized protein LOC125488817 n=1 Tax=Plutella xylostella TaxID=51655 RepID=UPI00203276AF|nr:uncharacterized protein LOC125488817 [Plutella xylostella]